MAGVTACHDSLEPGSEATLNVSDLCDEFALLKQMLSKELIFDPLASDVDILRDTLELFQKKGWVRSATESDFPHLEVWPLECLAGGPWGPR